MCDDAVDGHVWVSDLLVAHSVRHPDSFGHLDCSEQESTIGPARDRHWLNPFERPHDPDPWVQMLSSVRALELGGEGPLEECDLAPSHCGVHLRPRSVAHLLWLHKVSQRAAF